MGESRLEIQISELVWDYVLASHFGYSPLNNPNEIRWDKRNFQQIFVSRRAE